MYYLLGNLILVISFLHKLRPSKQTFTENFA